MNRDEFKAAYCNLLDKKGRVNANFNRLKNAQSITSIVMALTDNFPESIEVKDRLYCLLHGIDDWPQCEVCPKPVKRSNTGHFTPFCGFKCSRSKGSSTFVKAQQTCLVKYGVKSNLVTSEQLENKRKNGGIGAANPDTRDKIKKTNLEKYGAENVFSNEEVKNKIKKTHELKYGGNYHTVKLGDKLDRLQDAAYCKELAEKYCMSTVADMLGVASNTVYKYFEKHGIISFNRSRSNQEIEVLEFLKSCGISNIINGDRNAISPLEIDLYLPDYKMGIELDGLYWHSELMGCRPSYHSDKSDKAAAAGIFLIHIFENEWIFKKDIVKARLKSLLGLNSIRIPARKCEILPVVSNAKKDFINSCHLQGDCNSSINLGLYFDGALVSCMTFSRTRFDDSADYELLRFCSLPDVTVVGGFLKMLRYFIKEHPGCRIVSYADSRWSQGDVYKNCGFSYAGKSKPAYHYFKGSSLILENRMKYQKHKLKNILENVDETKSEWVNMREHGYNRIWDCGTTKWILYPEAAATQMPG